MQNLGGSELMIILLIVLVLFGGSKLPDLARNMGQAQREFRHGQRDGTGGATGETPARDQEDTTDQEDAT